MGFNSGFKGLNSSAFGSFSPYIFSYFRPIFGESFFFCSFFFLFFDWFLFILHWRDSQHWTLPSSEVRLQISLSSASLSILLYWAAAGSPSWYCLPISVVVFPQVFLHGIFYPVLLFRYSRIIHSL